MQNFRTSFTPTPSTHKITLQTPLLSVGSCFADTMGQRLQQHKFPMLANPFGVLFNPVSVATVLGQVLDRRLPREEHYLQNEGLWRHFDLHSDLAHEDLMMLEQAIHNTWAQVHEHLQETRWLMLTLGTATVHRFKETGQVVANCHKVPAQQFDKGLLTVAEVVGSLSYLFEKLAERYPDLRVVLSVSPVRHLKDTLPINSVSKATLRVAAHELCQAFPHQVQYFPAYELVMDDLRDYRFYAEDMLHLAPLAQQYVWEKFTEAYLSEDAQTFLSAWEGIRRDLTHRPRNPNGEAHQRFLAALLQKLEIWEGTVDVSEERARVEKALEKN